MYYPILKKPLWESFCDNSMHLKKSENVKCNIVAVDTLYGFKCFIFLNVQNFCPANVISASWVYYKFVFY